VKTVPKTHAARKAKATPGSLTAFFLLALLAAPVFAAQHPVPLDKGVKEEDCLQCHEDLTKGKVVHAAVGMGCFNCHVVRGSGDATRVTLKTPKSTSLCITCHADKKADNPKQHFHAPVGVDCLKCHTPHNSENKALLKKTSSGDKDSNLCLQCHTQGLNTPEKGSRHAALDMGCDTCHVTHKTGTDNTPEIAFHLTKSAPGLCIDCHDVKDSKLVAAHKNQPFGSADCTSCHDPHQSKSPKLLQKYVHPPFADGCDTCHEAPQNGKVKLTQPDAKTLCAMCHDEAAKKIENAKFPHAGAQGDCTACHNPHAGRYPRFVSPDPVGVCDSCHADLLELRNSKHVTHSPVSGQCSICHAPHGGDNPKLLRAQKDDLCLECHGSEVKGTPVAGTDKLSIFDKTVELPAKYLQSATHLQLQNGKGHPVKNHPVSGPDPSNKGAQFGCLRCHVPHAGDSKLLVTGGTGTGGPLCSQCHPKIK
jgi:predicted CXXCH cytochrome family protein